MAARFLYRKGYKILGKNVKTFVGEIDILAKKENLVVFVEVKTRKSQSFGPPYSSITERKKRKLIQCALCYLKMKNMHHRPWRIDIVSIVIKRVFWFVRFADIEYFENAINE